MYALNGNGLVNSTKLVHINKAINVRKPHSFVLTESKTNSKVGPELPADNYTIFEEPGVQAENHHLLKWGTVLGIKKGIQVAQQTNNNQDFIHRIIGAYAPWDPGTAATCDFWPELTKLCQSTSTSWTLSGDLNGGTLTADHPTGTTARAQSINFLAHAAGHDIWSNYPERNRNYD
ncbi:hypothetical protein B0H10DRAFT_1939978 [Mycena sp. CBHHK59/15]|nr:hypothetical protein B0H10DRAFT_1939978 [Mycena sp. CBHHK59/15]